MSLDTPMPPRVHEICTERHRQQTPAPLLQTRRGQLPNLPAQLAREAIPPGETLLLALPLQEWHMLNSNAGRLTKDVMSHLDTLPAGSVGAAGLTGQMDAVLFLTARAAGSRQTLCDAPGKSLAVRVDRLSVKAGVAPDAVAALHIALHTDFALVPTDAPPLVSPLSAGIRSRRCKRAIEQNRAFVSAALATGSTERTLIASVQGGIDVEARTLCGSAVTADNSCKGGVSVDGLFAGEDVDVRDKAIAVSLKATISAPGMRILTGGTGAPSDVLRAIAHGIDVVDASYPFDMAECGYATRLSCEVGPATHLNIRDRVWETCSLPIIDGCSCFACKGFSRAYVRHLFEVHEMMGVTLLAAHNLWDYLQWFIDIRKSITDGSFNTFIERFERGRRAHIEELNSNKQSKTVLISNSENISSE